jgi:DNA invertase Pin-like site-specific DNA recombinase
MSTDHQRYSIANQSEVISRYAERRGFAVVATYVDEGKSGLRLDGRNALRTLISDVESGAASFRAVLIYDVSRWGRFQDADESAYYEHICKRAGISVRYCAEPFENEGSPVSAIVKNVKRLMAGEYSRELSAKVFAGQRRLVRLGYRQGAPPGYGLRRLLIDEAGSPKSVLERGQLKSIHTDRVILVPGPAHEVRGVKWIFGAFINGSSERDIATKLNNRKILTHLGRAWTRAAVLEVLTNEKYVGHNIWNRTSKKLKGRKVKNDPGSWIRSDEAFEPLVDPKVFNAARQIMQRRTARRTDQDMLEKLGKVFQERGYLSAKTIAEAKGLMSSQAYKHRFGGLLGAYRRVGHTPERDYRFVQFGRSRKQAARTIMEQITAAAERAGAAVQLDTKQGRLTINGELDLVVRAARCLTSDAGSHRWNIVFEHAVVWDLLVVGRMDHDNTVDT